MKIIMFIDHDNCHFERGQLQSIIRSIVKKIPVKETVVVNFVIRLYGGWFEGNNASKSRIEAIRFYSFDLPSLLKEDLAYIRIRYEFADYLLNVDDLSSSYSEKVKICNTVEKRKRPLRIMAVPQEFNCEDQSCGIVEFKKWLKKPKACFKVNCKAEFEEAFARLEQKQVDVHMALDFVSAAEDKEVDYAVIATDDLDVIPAVLLVNRKRKGLKIILVRHNNKINDYLKRVISETTATVINF